MCFRDIDLLGWCPVSLTSWGEATFLALVGHPSSDGVTIKLPHGVDVSLHQSAWHPILFLLGWLKLNLIFFLLPTSVDPGLGRRGAG